MKRTVLKAFGYVLFLIIMAISSGVMAAAEPTAGQQTQGGMPTCSYRTHVQNVGWQDWKTNGETSGTTGLGLRLEGIEIVVNNQGYDLGVEYQTHVQNIGWQELKYNGETSGTTGQSLRLEAIRISLTGSDADLFDVYYRVHAQNFGWLGWTKNGDSAGTAGYGYRLEGIEIVITAKGGAAPGSTLRPFVSIYNLGIATTQSENYYDAATQKLLYESWYQRPIFYDNSQVQAKLDNVYYHLEDTWKQANMVDLQAFITSYTTNPTFKQNLIGKYENLVVAEIPYNRNNLVSITQENYTYTGGAHGMNTLTAHTFGTKTGDELLLKDVLVIPEAQISTELTAEFAVLKATNPRYSDIDLAEVASLLNGSAKYYLTDAGVCVYFDPYEVTYYAAGRVELIIPYSRTDLLVDFETLI
jgi:uncharacterized protein YjdB